MSGMRQAVYNMITVGNQWNSTQVIKPEIYNIIIIVVKQKI